MLWFTQTENIQYASGGSDYFSGAARYFKFGILLTFEISFKT
jgi:hypothetical protein